MIDRRVLSQLVRQILYIGLGLMIIFFRLAPVETTPPKWVGPEFMMAITFLFAIRRPYYVPSISVALIFLFSDLMLQRPPGLMSLLMVIACEKLRSRSQYLRMATFGVEWLAISLAVLFQMLGYHVALILTVSPPPPFGLSMMQTGATILLYPILAQVASMVFGIHKSPSNDIMIKSGLQ